MGKQSKIGYPSFGAQRMSLPYYLIYAVLNIDEHGKDNMFVLIDEKL